MGALAITSKPAAKLAVQPYRQWSPHLANCCLRLSATVSSEQAEQDVASLTGMRVPAKTQQRLVQGQTFALPTLEQPLELCVDGGKVRLRTPLGAVCQWRDYKALETDQGRVANWHNKAQFIEWVKEQPLAQPVTCFADGHEGVWKIISQIATASARRESLGWYHLKENRHKVGGSIKRLHQAAALLWTGAVEETIMLFNDCKRTQAKNFGEYLPKHQRRIVNYDYFQAEGLCAIGSGAVEFAIKQIDRRIQLSGAQ